MRVEVTENAVAKRISRALAKDGEVLRKTRGERARLDLGDYYVLNASRNYPTSTDVDLEALGRELGVLAEFETVASE